MKTALGNLAPSLRRMASVILATAGLALAATSGAQEEGPKAPAREAARVLRVDLAGPVIPGTASHLLSAVAAAEAGGYDAVLLVLNTPGGLLDSTREIVQAFLGADVPVVVYVSPSGSHAGSAGMFITIAGHVAAMAPGTNIGAAHPVTGGGKDPEESGGKIMAEKIENDTAAFARSIAEQRGRNVEWAEKAVRESLSATAAEAEKLGVIDLVTATETTLLDAIDGRTVNLASGEKVLHTKQARIERHPMTLQQRALSILGDPNLAAILGLIGVLGIMMELYNPGLIVPGAVGVLALLLAGIGYSVLPVNIGGVVLLLIAAVLFVTEIYVSSFGLLTLGGLGCLILGSMLLIDTSDPDFYVDSSFKVSWGVILPSALLMAGVALTMMVLVVRSERRKSTTGAEGLVGELGRARSEVGPEGGTVFVHGELWKAESAEVIPTGAEIEVRGIRGLVLEVAPRPPK